ncbi:MAG: GNAT family N-acetyltransferase [Crocinitomicaceae bacterium]
MEFKTFETERLILRPTQIEDADFIFELMTMPKWIRFIGDRGIKNTKDAEQYIEERMLPQLHKLGFGNYTVIRKSDHEKLGTSGLYDREGLEGLDIGFAFLERFEGQGYAYESSKVLVDYTFNSLNYKLIKGITDKENKSSQRLLEKLGLNFHKFVVLPDETEEVMLFQKEI